GLGSRFLRHVQRTRVLIHLLTWLPGTQSEPMEDYLALRRELERFDPELARRTELVVLSKCDLPDVQEIYEPLRQRFEAEHGKTLLALSSATGRGVKELLVAVAALLEVSASKGEPDPLPDGG